MNARTSVSLEKKAFKKLRNSSRSRLNQETEEALATLKLTVLEFSDGFTIGQVVRQPLKTFSQGRPAQEAS